MHRYILILIFLFALSGSNTIAQQAQKQEVVYLKNRILPLPVANVRLWLDSMAQPGRSVEPAQVLVHFTTLPTAAERLSLKQNGITLLDYLPDNTFSAIAQFPLNNDAILALPVHSILAARPEWKADDFIWKKVDRAQGAVEVLVTFCSGIDAAAVKQFVATLGGQVNPGNMEKYGSYKVVIASGKVRSLAQWYGVKYISPVNNIVPTDLQSRPAVKGNIAVAPFAYGGYELSGDSVTVGVGDNASAIYHADVKDRIVNFNPAPMATHGSHVNGIVGGAAIVDPLAASMAPHVSLIDHLYDLIISSTGTLYNDYNMTITNNSYTIIAADCDYSGTYDAYSQLLDTLGVQYPDVLHVFAAANDGWMNCTPFLPGFATVGGGYQPAKNNVVVGSMTDYLIQAADESRGPVKDGRLKPEIIAIGLGAYSTVGVDKYVWDAGTSMAAPQVAGGLAIITQHYKHLHGGAQPPAFLLKTLLLNGTMDLGNPGPDYSYGFGAMDVSRSLKMLDDNHYSTSSMSTGDSQSFTITVPPNTGQLKIMLSWSDPPASPSAAKQLVNDLDLVVIDSVSGSHLPLVLDPSPSHVNDNATEQADHLNNAEQVTIVNPASGTYTIKTKGYSIPLGPQQYAIAYDIQPKQLQLTYPIGGEQLSNVDSIRIFWNAVTDGNTFTAQFSPDNGGSWITIDNNIPATSRYCPFMPLGYNSGRCLVRVLRNTVGDIATSASFAISTQPFAQLAATQCPGSLHIHWSPIPGATAYQLFKKVGFYMQLVDTVTDTSYVFGGLSLTEKSYVAVEPVINGLPGYRSVAVIAVANAGDCAGFPATGDLTVERIVAPASGRAFTLSQLGTTSVMQVKLRNLYNVACTSYTLSYRINSGPWQLLLSPGAIPANDTAIVNIPGLSFAAPGAYHITVAVHNLALSDQYPGNDTLSLTILNIPNDPINLATPFADDFETLGKFSVTHDSLGVSPNGHWDYFNTNDLGRLRSFVNDDITITGNRSVSLDERQSVFAGSNNTFVGTFNLAAYDTATAEVRVDFDYLLHGMPKTTDGNIINARGSDGVFWRSLYSYDLNAYSGTLIHARSLSLTDALRLGGTNFSASTQLSFGQNDTSLISARNYGNGITLDNFRMYTVANDAQLVKVVSPTPTNCGMPAVQPLTVQVHNGVNYTLHNVALFYRMDGGTVFAGTLDSIRAKDTVNYTFAQPLIASPGISHSVDAWLLLAGDTYAANDSVKGYKFRNNNIITSYPYLEDFEAGDGGYYSDGAINTWQYGTPASAKVNKAASGVKAWKTNLTGHYKNLERSYLYSPCFDLSSLADPMLSFSAAMDIENCGNTLCDEAYMEYSFDGAEWIRLGSTGMGTNWYDSTFNAWNTNGFTRWHVASIPLPQPGVGQSIRLRFAMVADPGASFEGVAIDDIHIFDRTNAIFPSIGTATSLHDISSNNWFDFLTTNQLLASIRPHNGTLAATRVTLYTHDTVSNHGATQYTMPRSYTILDDTEPVDSMGLRLFLTEDDVVSIVNDTTCPSCGPLPDAYSLGITQYSNPQHRSLENASLSDDTAGVFTYYPRSRVRWVPYDNGYYAELTVRTFSEFWFNNGGPTAAFAANADYLSFVAFKSGLDVITAWYSLIDTAVGQYTLQRSDDGITFTNILDTLADHANPGQYAWTDAGAMANPATWYYRLRWTMPGKDGYFYAPIRRVSDTDYATNLVSLNARMVSHTSALADWTSYIDGITDHYILERAIDNGSYTIIANVPSLHLYGHQYLYNDMPAGTIREGTPIHYRLTAVLGNGSTVLLPIRTIAWDNANAVVNIFPNPTHRGNLTIQWHADAGTLMNISITDAVGKRLYEGSATASQWNNATTFETARYPTGIYFVRIDIGGSKYTAKVVYE